MEYKYQAYNAAKEIIEIAGLKSGQILIVGCSTSEISGEKIGTDSSPEIAREVFDGIYAAANEKGVFVAAQCCEHLNRAVICERAAAPHAVDEQNGQSVGEQLHQRGAILHRVRLGGGAALGRRVRLGGRAPLIALRGGWRGWQPPYRASRR